MNLSQAVKMAAKSIFSNKGRSALTMLGIIIGLAAVIILVSYAQGQNMAMQKYYESMGSNKIQVSAWTYNSSTDVGQILYDYCLKLDDLVVGITPNMQLWDDITIKYESKTLARNRGGGMGGMVSMTPSGGGGIGGMEEEYPTIALGNDQYGLCNDYTIAKGRDLSYLDIEKDAKVCVLGAATAEYLFSFADPIDKIITIKGVPFRVVGVYEAKASSSSSTSQDDYWINEAIKRLDRLVLLPSSMTRLFNNNQSINEFVIKSKDRQSTKDAITLLNGFGDSLFPKDEMGNSQKGSLSVYSEDTYIEQNNEASAMQQRFLAGIAAISLLVGGIGIMNIMLVTVTERTREIGIRKAIGAERRSIITQFLVEAAMICGIGGLFGIAVGYVGTMIVSKLSFNIVMFPSPDITVASAGISIALGIIFGLYPAIKASGLQPVVALRAD